MIFRVITLSLFGALLGAQSTELGFTLGGLIPRERGPLDIGSGVAFQFNYGQRLWKNDQVAVLGEVHFLASPLRNVDSNIPTAVRDFASLYLTPGVRVKFRPEARFSPYLTAGFGYAQYESSELLNNGSRSSVRGRQHTYAGSVGGGADWKFFGPISLRGELRHWFSPSPRFNTPLSGTQHNTVLSGGFVIRLGK
ncbi:MAG: porin family protein [Bryobacteraceae bacterium]|nr:porin family protein [Bryobacteraceae bacterium]